MKRHASLAALAATAASAALAAAAPVHAAAADPSVPGGDIAVTGDHKVILIGHAEGVQIYRCNGSEWSLHAPRATLYGDSGKVVATHYGGPTWEARDGSTVVGRRVASVPSPDPTAIPWLKLEAASNTVGADGERFTSVTYVQRYNTSGGVAPAASTCDAEHTGALDEVPYTADYAFWR